MKSIIFVSSVCALLTVLALSFPVQAFSCRRVEPTQEYVRAQIAYKKFAPPQSWFLATSILGNAYSFLQLKNREPNGSIDKWEIEDNFAVVAYSLSFIMWMQGDCRAKEAPAVDENSVAVKDLDLETAKQRQALAHTLHLALNSVPTILAASFRSQKSDRWQTVGVALLAPYAMDFLLRAKESAI